MVVIVRRLAHFLAQVIVQGLHGVVELGDERLFAQLFDAVSGDGFSIDDADAAAGLGVFLRSRPALENAVDHPSAPSLRRCGEPAG